MAPTEPPDDENGEQHERRRMGRLRAAQVRDRLQATHENGGLIGRGELSEAVKAVLECLNNVERDVDRLQDEHRRFDSFMAAYGNPEKAKEWIKEVSDFISRAKGTLIGAMAVIGVLWVIICVIEGVIWNQLQDKVSEKTRGEMLGNLDARINLNQAHIDAAIARVNSLEQTRGQLSTDDERRAMEAQIVRERAAIATGLSDRITELKERIAQHSTEDRALIEGLEHRIDAVSSQLNDFMRGSNRPTGSQQIMPYERPR
jgi:hypothetical protein